jgi:hypothetical protein
MTRNAKGEKNFHSSTKLSQICPSRSFFPDHLGEILCDSRSPHMALNQAFPMQIACCHTQSMHTQIPAYTKNVGYHNVGFYLTTVIRFPSVPPLQTSIS